jgi:hypothetical protein
MAWDGTTFTESDAGRRLTPGLLLVGTPWLPFYATAASLAIFGESAAAARLPFALAGLATLILLYALVLRMTADRLAATLASALLLVSVQFLLYARQCRHYALNMALSLALLLAFDRLARRRFDWLFVATGVLLFHCHPLPAAVTLATLGGATLLLPAFRPMRRGFWTSLPAILALTAPWVLFARGGWEENSRLLMQPAEVVPRLVQFAFESSIALPLVGWLILTPLAWRRLTERDSAALALLLALVAAYAAVTPIVQNTRQMWEYGLRYANALLPVGAAVTGILVARASSDPRRSPPARYAGTAVAIAALFAGTHLPGRSALWLLTDPAPPPEDPPAPARTAMHAPKSRIDELLRTELAAFARELVATSPGTLARTVVFLDANAAPGDRVVTNYEWEPLYFHTRLPQAYKVLESYPILAAARAAGLPDYVFEPDTARWLVWRAPWEDYQGYRWAEVAARLRAAGATLVPVASFPETVWENRENLHFRRFPGVGHLFPGAVPPVYPPAKIWRIDSAATARADALPRSPARPAPRAAPE